MWLVQPDRRGNSSGDHRLAPGAEPLRRTDPRSAETSPRSSWLLGARRTSLLLSWRMLESPPRAYSRRLSLLPGRRGSAHLPAAPKPPAETSRQPEGALA